MFRSSPPVSLLLSICVHIFCLHLLTEVRDSQSIVPDQQHRGLWELVRNANSYSSPSRPTESVPLGRVQTSVFSPPLQGILHLNIWESPDYISLSFMGNSFKLTEKLQVNRTKTSSIPLTQISQLLTFYFIFFPPFYLSVCLSKSTRLVQTIWKGQVCDAPDTVTK